MSTPASPATRPDLSDRDLTLDLARVLCVVFVIVVHLLMVGIGPGPDGQLVTSRPAEQEPWFDAATWVGQIMPLFFVVGGFASAAGWASWTRKGGDAVGFIRTRTLRLAQPALPVFAFFALVLGATTLAGIAPDLVAAAAVGAGSPLWFLAAYLICQALVPVLVRLHERAPRGTVAVLAAGVVVVDIARFATGVTEIGLLNLLFVWPLIQQLGFWYRDGWFDRRPTGILLLIAAACGLALWPLVAWGPYSPSMLGNLNPPTLPLVLLGLAQACLLRVLRPALTRLTRVRAVQGFLFLLGTRLMTVYLWHLPVILAVTGVTLLIPGAAPTPSSAAWWWSRPLMFVVVLAAVLALSVLIARWEALGTLGPSPSPVVVGIAWLCAVAPPFAVMQWFLDLPLAVGGTVLLTVSVVLLRHPLFAARTRAASVVSRA
ncbi:MAG: acyltransferase [Candidatus Microbacterium phytovorans]|uniref:Acyltransferase n=1 Tax=Candidatus Microbacterium phytovorans TaxID=3121374 RepID=A0AAJ5VZH7_9MICO|nr:acyltransferase [Microbacterium sp.]WEK12299.1 MAG: acyltransferase [Microbacterium sp.]